MHSLQHCFVQTHICKKDFLEWVNFTYNHSWLWFKWFWNLYCTRKGSHIHYFEETSWTLKPKKKYIQAEISCCMMKSSYYGTRLETWLLQFAPLKDLPSILSFEEEKNSLTWKMPDKSSKRRRHSAPVLLGSAAKKQIFNVSQCQQICMNVCQFGHMTHIFHLIPDGRQHTQPGWLFGSSSKAGGPSSCSTNCPLALSSNISATIPLWFGCFPSRHLDK